MLAAITTAAAATAARMIHIHDIKCICVLKSFLMWKQMSRGVRGDFKNSKSVFFLFKKMLYCLQNKEILKGQNLSLFLPLINLRARKPTALL